MFYSGACHTLVSARVQASEKAVAVVGDWAGGWGACPLGGEGAVPGEQNCTEKYFSSTQYNKITIVHRQFINAHHTVPLKLQRQKNIQ